MKHFMHYDCKVCNHRTTDIINVEYDTPNTETVYRVICEECIDKTATCITCGCSTPYGYLNLDNECILCVETELEECNNA
jgi:hypothetical protein